MQAKAEINQGKGHILGIDPGFKGGMAQLDGLLNLVSSHPLPTNTLTMSERTQLDLPKLAAILIPLAPLIQLAVIEEVGAMPDQGVTGIFRFGQSTGQIEGMLAALQIKMIRIKPAVWKSALGLSHDKSTSLALAARLFSRSFTKKEDGIAEAALLAYFASTKILGRKVTMVKPSIYD